MDLKASKKLLHKIEALINNLDESEKLSRLEQDLILSYVRSLYENLLPGSHPDLQAFEMTSRVVQETPVKSPEPKPVEKKETHQHSEPVQQVKPEPQGKDEKDFFQPSYFEKKPAEQPRQEPVSDRPPEIERKEYQPPVQQVSSPAPFEKPADEEKQIENPITNGKHEAAPVEHKGMPTPPKESTTPTVKKNDLEAIFDTPRSVDLSDRLSSQPLQRIESGLGINERILTINELFGGDITAFESALSKLNTLSDFNEAKSFLIEGPASKYNWEKEDKIKKAGQFIRLVRRKYV